MVAQNPGRGGRGNDGAMAAQNPGRGGRGNDGAMAAQNPGRGGRGNGGAMAAQNPGRGGGAVIVGVCNGTVAGQNPGGGEGAEYVTVMMYLGRGGAGMRVDGEDDIQELLPPNEVLGGYIFMCDEDTLPRITELMVFGYPDASSFRDRVRAITPRLPLFLYNQTTLRLHGIYEAAGNGGYNIEPGYFPCFHDLRRSSYPAQVRVRWRTEYQPLDEQMTAGIMDNLINPRNNFYTYRVELTVAEAANIINVFAENGVAPE